MGRAKQAVCECRIFGARIASAGSERRCLWSAGSARRFLCDGLYARAHARTEFFTSATNVGLASARPISVYSQSTNLNHSLLNHTSSLS